MKTEIKIPQVWIPMVKNKTGGWYSSTTAEGTTFSQKMKIEIHQSQPDQHDTNGDA